MSLRVLGSLGIFHCCWGIFFCLDFLGFVEWGFLAFFWFGVLFFFFFRMLPAEPLGFFSVLPVPKHAGAVQRKCNS